jgi:hypothetical protein
VHEAATGAAHLWIGGGRDGANVKKRGEVVAAAEVNPVVDRPQEAPAFGGEPASIFIDQCEAQHLLIEVASLRMGDDDVPLPDVGHAVPTLGMLAEALPYHGALLVGDEPGQLLPQENLGIGVLVDLVALGDRLDEYSVFLHREEILRLAGLGPGLVQVEGLALPVHMLDGHENSPALSIPKVARTTRLGGWTSYPSWASDGMLSSGPLILWIEVSGNGRKFAILSLDTPSRHAYSSDRPSSISAGLAEARLSHTRSLPVPL